MKRRAFLKNTSIAAAGLVAALWAVAGDMLTDAFTSAIQDTVGGP